MRGRRVVRNNIFNTRRIQRLNRRRVPTDSGRDARLPRVPVTMPRFGMPPPIPRVIEKTPMKRELIELPVDEPGTSTPTIVSQVTIIQKLTSLNLPALSVTVHRILAYQINQQDPGVYDPLTLTDSLSGYQQEFAGVPGKEAPRGMIVYPAQYSLPFPGTSTSTASIAQATFVDRLYVDISLVFKSNTSLDTPTIDIRDDISDFHQLDVASTPRSSVSVNNRAVRSGRVLKK